MYGTLQCLIPTFPWIAPGWRAGGGGGCNFGHLATLLRRGRAGGMARALSTPLHYIIQRDGRFIVSKSVFKLDIVAVHCGNT